MSWRTAPFDPDEPSAVFLARALLLKWEKENRPNAERQSRARAALKPYADEDDLETPVIDLLTDLRHYCAAKGLDFERLLSMSSRHFSVEGGRTE